MPCKLRPRRLDPRGSDLSLLKPFKLYRPATIPEACRTLEDLGEDAAAYAGGTELLLAMKEGFLAKTSLVDLKGLDMASIVVAPGGKGIRIGALTTHRQIERSEILEEQLPIFPEMESRLANVRVRNTGTLGGNMVFNEPHADPATVLTVLDARIRVANRDHTTDVSCEDFFLEPFVTSLRRGEIVTEVILPPVDPGTGMAYLRFGHLERPTIGVAALVRVSTERVEDARVCVGAVGPRPFRLRERENDLQGQGLDRGLEQAFKDMGNEIADRCDVYEDSYGGVKYKKHLTATLVRRALSSALARATRGEGDAE